MASEVYTINEVAKMFNKSPGTVHSWIRKGKLQTIERSSGTRKFRVVTARQLRNFEETYLKS